LGGESVFELPTIQKSPRGVLNRNSEQYGRLVPMAKELHNHGHRREPASAGTVQVGSKADFLSAN